jgi:PKD repeat protein
LGNSNWSNDTKQHPYPTYPKITSGWHLVSNPYPSVVKLSSIDANFDSQIQIWNADGQYAFSYQPATVGVDAVLAPFQAFMVHVKPGHTGNFTINASDRVRSTQRFYSLGNDNELEVVAENTDNGLLDKTLIAFNTNATDSFDPQFDANKSYGGLTRHTLCTVNDGKWLSRNILHSVAETAAVPMGLDARVSGNYKFTFTGINTFDPTTYITLEDKKLGTMFDLRSGDYSFSADSGDSWNRFVIQFTPPVLISTTDAVCGGSAKLHIEQPGTANWKYTLTDSNNAVVATGVLNQNAAVDASLAMGTYTLTLVDNNNYTVIKPVVLSGTNPVNAGFTASATNVAPQVNVVFTNISANATGYNWNFGDGYVANNVENPVHAYAAPGTYTVVLTATGPSGCNGTKAQTITVADATTGIGLLAGGNNVDIWSSNNRIFVSFASLQKVDAVINIFDILGQQLGEDRVTSNILYQKEVENMDAGYVVVRVKMGEQLLTKKLLIINNK